MALYDKPVRLLMHDMVRDTGLEQNQIIDRSEVIDWFGSNYPLVKESTVSAHLTRMSVNAASRLHHNIQPDGSDDLFFQVDRSRFRLFDPEKDPAPIRSQEDLKEVERVSEDESTREASEFAYERDLRDFLAKNLHLIEPGLALYDEEGVKGIEFPAGGRFIDILAKDAEDRYVVIELKVSRGYDRVVGQLLRYVGWIEEHHAENGEGVRGMIVAKEITDDLKLACRRVHDVELFEYELAVSVRPVN